MPQSTPPRELDESPKSQRYKRLSPKEFVDAAAVLLKSGWHPIPIGNTGGKTPLVSGVTGYDGKDVDDPAVLDEWAEQFASSGNGLNLATRVPFGVIGIDVDDYDKKHGSRTLADCETRWGGLPETWMTTARDDGSGIRWFRLPQGCGDHRQWRAVGVLPGGDVEVIQRHHRFGAVPPSIHKSGARYRVIGPGGDVCDALPSPDALPFLPGSWVHGLQREGGDRPERGHAADGLAVLGGLEDGGFDQRVSDHLSVALASLDAEGSRYDGMNAAVLSLIRAGAFGARGVPTALRVLRREYVDSVADARGGERFADREFDKAVEDGSRILAGEKVSTETYGALDPGGLWHPDTPHPGRNRKHLRKLGLMDDDGRPVVRSRFDGAHRKCPGVLGGSAHPRAGFTVAAAGFR